MARGRDSRTAHWTWEWGGYSEVATPRRLSGREFRAEIDEVPADLDRRRVSVRVEPRGHVAAVQIPDTGLSGGVVRDIAVARDRDRSRAVGLEPDLVEPGIRERDRLAGIEVGPGGRLARKDPHLLDEVAVLVEEVRVDLSALDVDEDRKGALVGEERVACRRERVVVRRVGGCGGHNRQRHENRREEKKTASHEHSFLKGTCQQGRCRFTAPKTIPRADPGGLREGNSF